MRQVGVTSMNASSSRSHCVFVFRISIKDEASGECKLSQTNLVDLAGSERAKRTQADGARLKEGANINQSLSVLARVISSLADRNRGSQNPPFRDSRLTYLLKESLSGNSKTVMVAAVSPSNWDYDETMSTLKFQSVKLVQTSAKQNKDNEQNIERQLRAEADELKAKLLELEVSNSLPAAIERAQQQLTHQERSSCGGTLPAAGSSCCAGRRP
ncbi:unnamed protein product [Prorocentrum cordatum]|uniref:Kinesin motor domain-containing protein n=1 Tax=Prorocentrum cordatum TaxID=2364126 RepID=A0ABN9UHZ8_9DINO|nr:unnamed protein product [Polarella glacialis]